MVDDEALLQTFAAGQPRSFDELFARYSREMLSFLSRLVTVHGDPEDLLQETFLRVLTHARDFRPGASFRIWLFTIARRVAYNALKKSKLRDELEVRMDLSVWESGVEREPWGDPAQYCEGQEQKARLLSALEELPTPHREIIVLTVFDGFSYEEAALITGEPAGTLRSRAFHALRKLRTMLEERKEVLAARPSSLAAHNARVSASPYEKISAIFAPLPSVGSHRFNAPQGSLVPCSPCSPP